MNSTFFLSTALLWLLLAWSTPGVSAGGQPTPNFVDCAPATQNDTMYTWWSTDGGLNPCQVLQKLLLQCDPGHTIHLMPQSPLHSPDICQSEAKGGPKGNDNFVPCCCNRVAYALRQACWSCQQGRIDPIKPDRRPTLQEYMQCDRTVNHPNQVLQAVSPPVWAQLKLNPSQAWNFTNTRLKVLAGNLMVMEGANPLAVPQGGGGGSSKDKDGDGKDDSKDHGSQHPPSSDHSPPPTPASSQAAAAAEMHKMMITIIAVVGGICAGLLAVALPFIIMMCIQRRRRRQRAAPDWHNKWQDEKQPDGPYPFSVPASVKRCGSQSSWHPDLIDERRAVDEEQFQPIPRPHPRRGKADKVLGVSWVSDWAKPIRPGPPPDPTPTTDTNFGFEDALHTEDTQRMQLSDERVRSSWAWSPIARMTPSMVRAPSKKATPQPTIKSFFANTEHTHSLSV